MASSSDIKAEPEWGQVNTNSASSTSSSSAIAASEDDALIAARNLLSMGSRSPFVNDGSGWGTFVVKPNGQLTKKENVTGDSLVALASAAGNFDDDSHIDDQDDNGYTKQQQQQQHAEIGNKKRPRGSQSSASKQKRKIEDDNAPLTDSPDSSNIQKSKNGASRKGRVYNPYRKKYSWDDVLHNKFLSLVFLVGLHLDHPFKVLEALEQCGVPKGMYTDKDVKEQVDRARAYEQATITAFHQHLELAQRAALKSALLAENKGGRPKFHCYPFTTTTELGELPPVPEFCRNGPQMYNLKLLAAIFDVGLIFCKPKPVFQAIIPVPKIPDTEFSVRNVKTHLQKYRNNCQASRMAFRESFLK